MFLDQLYLTYFLYNGINKFRCAILFFGTFVTFAITYNFIAHLPGWVFINVEDEEEPPAPNETLIKDFIPTGDSMKQKFVSPAVLQANETGALVRVSRGRFVRTRKLTALGFEPIMNQLEMALERDILLEHVATNPPKQRTRTLSVPGIDIGFNFGMGGIDTVWDSHRERSNTDYY